MPAWPQLQWEFRDGYYCLTESDIDKVLDYWENQIPEYRYEMELYQKKLQIILDALE